MQYREAICIEICNLIDFGEKIVIRGLGYGAQNIKLNVMRFTCNIRTLKG